MGQPEEVSAVAHKYILCVLPGYLLGIHFECIQSSLVAQGIFKPTLTICIITLGIHIALLYFFIIIYDFQIYGVAIADSVTKILQSLLLSLYISFNPKIIQSKQWFFLDKEAYQKIPEFLKYGAPA